MHSGYIALYRVDTAIGSRAELGVVVWQKLFPADFRDT